LELKVIDEIIPEPVGGAHRDRDLILDNVRKSIEINLNEFFTMSRDEVLNHRKNKFLAIGRTKGFVSQLDNLSVVSVKKKNINIFIENFFKSKMNLGIFFAIVVLLSYLIFIL
jgi:acetyl-CoA carboxylase carboxyl transferase subunit alpha